MTAGRSGAMGGVRVWYREVTSTMDVAAALAAGGAPHGTVVQAAHQSAGRGRMARRWTAPPSSALLTSWIMRADTGRSTGILSPLAALALIRVVEWFALAAPVAYKWPNDVLIDGRKLAGILLRCTTNGAEQVVIAGIGVNVTAAPEGGACLRTWCDTVEVDPLRDELARHLEAAWAAWCASDRLSGDDRDALESRMIWRGDPVEIQEAAGTVTGRIVGLEPDGALCLRLPGSGSHVAIHAGEILRGPRPARPFGPEGCRILP